MNLHPPTCPCKSGKAYSLCCKPYHLGDRLPESAFILMRSRYAAYALGLPEYIITTTHPDNPQYGKDLSLWRQEIAMFAQETEFKDLTIHAREERGQSATVTFTAHLLQRGKDASFTEKSDFEKVEGRWLYLKGSLIFG